MRIRERGSAPGALSVSPLLAARIALGAFGVWVASIGLRALLRGHPFAANAPVGRWLVSGVLAHDAVIAPTVFLLGAVTVRLAGPRTRQALAAILLIGGSVLIVGLPDVLRKGHNANPTVTPLDYTRNLLIVLLAVVGGVVIATAASALRQRRRERRAALPLLVREQSAEVHEPGPEADVDVDVDEPEIESDVDADGVPDPDAENIVEVENEDGPAADDDAPESAQADPRAAAGRLPPDSDTAVYRHDPPSD